MDGFRRVPPTKGPQPQLPQTPPAPAAPVPQPITTPIPLQKKSKKKMLLWSLGGLVAALLLAVGGTFWWYTAQLAPVDSSDMTKRVVTIEAGSTPSQIAEYLAEEQLIRSKTAFLWHARFEGVQNNLQAGAYRLSPSESTPDIVTHLSNGKVDTFDITFLPGATLADNREVLLDVGYSAAEVDAALGKSYNSPLFEGKPASADLEGYIYGETYAFGTGASVESVLEYTFEHFYGVVQKHNLVERYKARGLNLYEGITLASIIQREASSTPGDKPQIAQVFFSRLAINMPLGSDVTYQYIADKTGVPRDVNLDSPYNTRRYTGLPPGPIAAPGEGALQAVAQPAQGNYLYFLSGDDDVTYFSRTFEEHEANIAKHCKIKCQIL